MLYCCKRVGQAQGEGIRNGLYWAAYCTSSRRPYATLPATNACGFCLRWTRLRKTKKKFDNTIKDSAFSFTDEDQKEQLQIFVDWLDAQRVYLFCCCCLFHVFIRFYIHKSKSDRVASKVVRTYRLPPDRLPPEGRHIFLSVANITHEVTCMDRALLGFICETTARRRQIHGIGASFCVLVKDAANVEGMVGNRAGSTYSSADTTACMYRVKCKYASTVRNRSNS